MPIYTYTKDLREQEGELARPGDIKDNLEDIQDAVNGLTWVNVDRGSLDQFHVKPGEAYKEIAGKYSEFDGPAGSPWPSYAEVARLSFPVRPNAGVYVVASASWDASSLDYYAIGPRRTRLRLSARSIAQGIQTGSYEQPSAYNLEANGGAGIVWAYRVEAGTQHEVSFEIAHHGSGSFPNTSRPARVNFVVFVIDR
jgi:hypothetical protein